MAKHIPTQKEPVVPPQDDDDVALLRLGGWALFSCLSYRKNALKGKSKIKHTTKKLEEFKSELKLLEALVDKNKTHLPKAISSQDRGYMTLPCPSLMPYLKVLNKAIKRCINPSTLSWCRTL